MECCKMVADWTDFWGKQQNKTKKQHRLTFVTINSMAYRG